MLLRNLLGPLISKLVMPSQRIQKNLADQFKNAFPDNVYGNPIQYLSIPSTGEAILDAAQVGQSEDLENQKIIIYAGGNGETFESSLQAKLLQRLYDDNLAVFFIFAMSEQVRVNAIANKIG